MVYLWYHRSSGPRWPLGLEFCGLFHSVARWLFIKKKKLIIYINKRKEKLNVIGEKGPILLKGPTWWHQLFQRLLQVKRHHRFLHGVTAVCIVKKENFERCILNMLLLFSWFCYIQCHNFPVFKLFKLTSKRLSLWQPWPMPSPRRISEL